jgi:hypothetical protein
VEDQALRRLVGAYGLGQWEAIAACMPERSARQCRERYDYYLAPSAYCRPWTPEEDARLEEKVAECGSRWALLTRFFPGRDSGQLKSRWHTAVARRRRTVVDAVEWENEDDNALTWHELSPFDSFE